MSEYHYYEFVAIDQPLTTAARAALRKVSSRAEITATRFTNTYNYHDFRSDPAKVLARYFDASVYVSSFGIRRVAFRFPRESINAKAVRPYLCDGVLKLTTTPDHAVLTFEWNDEEGGDWVDEEEAEGWLTVLLPIREQLLRGDLAPLYVAWLRYACVEYGVYEQDREEAATVKEPPVPLGLRAANVASRSLVAFLGVDEDLFAAAAESSTEAVATEPDPEALSVWIAKRAMAEKNELLSRVAAGEGARVQTELQRRFAAQQRVPAGSAVTAPRRTFAQIAARAGVLAEKRKRAKAAAKEKRKREKAAAAERKRVADERAETIARETRLDALASCVPAAWTDVDALIAQRSAPAYDEMIALLLDLHALAVREGTVAAFNSKLRALRERYPGKPALHRRLSVFTLA